MQQQQVILQPIPPNHPVPSSYIIKRSSRIKLFSLFVLITFSVGVYHWYEYYSNKIGSRSLTELSRYELLDLLEYDNDSNMEELFLKYRLYRFPMVAYTQPNILMAICIFLTFPTVLNFIQKETATPIAFFQFNLCSIYLQIVRIILDYGHYVIASKCICLISGTGAIWVHLLTKIVFYNSHRIVTSPLKIITISLTYITAFSMVFYKDRLDLFLAIALALLDIAFLQGGTIKYPKEVFQQKQQWAEAIRLNRSPLWQSFNWNEYSVNELLCVNSSQFYMTREDRMILISKD